MAVQIRGNQIADNAIIESKLNNGAVAFAKIKTADVETDLGASANASKLASAAAIKNYVDSVAAGLDPKESVFVATTANITLSGTQTIDGSSVTAGKRVLVKDQSSAVENGIYICDAGSWSRSSDFAAGSAEAGAYMFVEAGTANATLKFVCTSQAGSDVVGTNAINFSVYSGPDSTTAGDGLQKTGDAISVKLDGSTIAASASGIKVADGQITNTQISNSAAIAVSKLAASTISGKSLGGNLDSLSAQANGGIAMSSYNGASAISNLRLSLVDLPDGAVNVANDFIAIVDADDSGASKVESIADLMTAVAGTGLTSTDGALNVGGLTNTEISNSAAIAITKLAASTISGKSLGTNLDSLSADAAGGLSMSSYNGSSAVTNLKLDLNSLSAASIDVASDSIAFIDGSDNTTKKESLVDFASGLAGDGLEAVSGEVKAKLDGSTLARSASGLKINNLGVGTGQLANSGVTPAKLSFQSRQDILTPNGSTTAFNLANEVDNLLHNMVLVFRNGLLCKLVGSSPSDESEYTIANAGGSTTITFGAAPASGELLDVRSFA